MPSVDLTFVNSKPIFNAQIITNGVGAQAHARPHDAALVQALLRAVHGPGSLDPYYKGRIDGMVGQKTLSAIRGFQSTLGGLFNGDRDGFLAQGGKGIRELTRQARKHLLVPSGSVTPYLPVKISVPALRARVQRLEWLEPTFRADLEEFAIAVFGEVGIGVNFRPLPGTAHPQCETTAEMVLEPIHRLRVVLRDAHSF